MRTDTDIDNSELIQTTHNCQKTDIDNSELTQKTDIDNWHRQFRTDMGKSELTQATQNLIYVMYNALF